MLISFTDFIGACGATLIVVAYFLLQTRILTASSIVHQVLNSIGAAQILYSLYYHPNLGAVAVEIFWLAISLYALVRVVIESRAVKRARSQPDEKKLRSNT